LDWDQSNFLLNLKVAFKFLYFTSLISAARFFGTAYVTSGCFKGETYMAFNDDMFHGKWTEIKGEIQKKWGHLTDNDLEATKGNATSLLGLIQQKVGMAKEEGSQYLH